MIKNTFIFIPGIGYKTEEKLWKEGIIKWHQFALNNNSFISSNKRKIIKGYLYEAQNALKIKKASFFLNLLPNREHWRLYKSFNKKTLFLDIESTGLSIYYDKITIIGTYDGNNIKFFIRGVNLEEIVDYLENFEVIITFNGKLFDVPFIKKEFEKIKIPPIHIDLRFLLRSLGITGTLKEIEERLNIHRPNELQDIDGKKATILWKKFTQGNDKYLEKLLLYNSYDTINLENLMNYCYVKKINEIKSKVNSNYYMSILEKTINKHLKNYKSNNINLNIPKIKMISDKNNIYIKINRKNLIKFRKKQIEKDEIKIEYLLNKIKNRKIRPLSIGIDLSGSEDKNSGICILDNENAQLDLIKTDAEIITKISEIKPIIISIDSPLGIPKGRCCADDNCDCRKFGIIRECERILKKRGVNVYPCLIKSMQKLTLRGMKLAKIFRKKGFKVIESYPGAAQDILGFPRKRVDLNELKNNLKEIGIISFNLKERKVSHDEIDALTSALVGYFYLADEFEALGNSKEEYLIIPKIKKNINL